MAGAAEKRPGIRVAFFYSDLPKSDEIRAPSQVKSRSAKESDIAGGVRAVMWADPEPPARPSGWGGASLPHRPLELLKLTVPFCNASSLFSARTKTTSRGRFLESLIGFDESYSSRGAELSTRAPRSFVGPRTRDGRQRAGRPSGVQRHEGEQQQRDRCSAHIGQRRGSHTGKGGTTSASAD